MLVSDPASLPVTAGGGALFSHPICQVILVGSLVLIVGTEKQKTPLPFWGEQGLKALEI
jgi:hypothetical protein